MSQKWMECRKCGGGNSTPLHDEAVTILYALADEEPEDVLKFHKLLAATATEPHLPDRGWVKL